MTITPKLHPDRWRPRWAIGVAGILLAAALAAAILGILMAISDQLNHTDMFDGLGTMLGLLIAVPGVAVAVPLVVFFARRGGRVPFFIGAGLAAAVGLVFVWAEWIQPLLG
ncbi:MAG: hypothetical protein QM713_10980 [Arachnia sp.]